MNTRCEINTHTSFLHHSCTNSDDFAKTGSGQTEGNAENRGVFSQDGWIGGPSWMVVTGVDGMALHDLRWPLAWQRPNITAQGATWADFYGFGDVFDSCADAGGSLCRSSKEPLALTDQRFFVAFPPLANDTAAASGVRKKTMGLTESTVDRTCKGMQLTSQSIYYIY
jgi:hypothetical protein